VAPPSQSMLDTVETRAIEQEKAEWMWQTGASEQSSERGEISEESDCASLQPYIYPGRGGNEEVQGTPHMGCHTDVL